ncbi:hypothetical protein CASFOL_001305 [Castilleja foliolosa]|uniref:Threonylcarbamoyl-AMP synthase n=1 Tax=Castilleja foliolosa TaxID=1961234 RepID=A0ABD3ER27_9LAMI
MSRTSGCYANVKADTILIESELEAKAILDLIPILNIRNLVLGATKSTIRRMRYRKGNGVVDQIVQSAPEFCEVKIICEGKEMSELMMMDKTPSPSPSQRSTADFTPRFGQGEEKERTGFDSATLAGDRQVKGKLKPIKGDVALCPLMAAAPPIFSSSPTTVTGPRLQYLNTLSSRRDIGRVWTRRVAVKDAKSGLVQPATEDYAAEAVEAVRAGKVIDVPTDTLYGFSCDACSMEAVKQIYEIKGRKYTKPLAICVSDVEDIQRFADTQHLPLGLFDSLLPGPVTVVLRRMTLRIKRVPTVVSNYQKEEAEDGPHHAAVCARNCLKSCCLTGAKLPLYAFKNENKVVSVNKEPRVEFLSSLLLREWEDRMQEDCFAMM